MRNFYIDKIKYSCPRGLDECDAEQVGLVMAYQIGQLMFVSGSERTAAKVQLLCSLTGLEQQTLNKLTAAQAGRLLNCVAWAKAAKVTEKKPFVSFDFAGVRYVLPAENLADTSSIELAMCTIYHLAFGREVQANRKAIFSIIATICRPERADLAKFRKSAEWNGDVREEYNSRVAEERALAFEKMPFGLCKAIFDYWVAMAEKFWKRYESMLGETDEDPMYLNGEGQVTMLMDIAEMGVFGNFEAVCKQNVHTVFIFLKDKKLKAERMARQMERQNDDSNE